MPTIVKVPVLPAWTPLRVTNRPLTRTSAVLISGVGGVTVTYVGGSGSANPTGLRPTDGPAWPRGDGVPRVR